MNSHIPLIKLQEDISKIGLRVQGKRFSNVELCRIDEVDTTNKVVSAYFFDSGRFRKGVPYCYPMYNNGYGIIIVPTKGAIGVAVWDAFGQPIIISFTAPTTITENGVNTRNIPKLGSFNLPELLEGEILIESAGHSFIKFDKLGGVALSSALFGYLKLGADGTYELDIEGGEININGLLIENYTDDYGQILKIVKGKHYYTPTQYSQGGVELCYRISIIGGEKENKFIGIGTDGNIYFSGKFINWGEQDGRKVRREKRKRANFKSSKRRRSSKKTASRYL